MYILFFQYFSGFFDTEVGAKQECDSYKNILSKIDEKPSNVVFLTDVVKGLYIFFLVDIDPSNIKYVTLHAS